MANSFLVSAALFPFLAFGAIPSPYGVAAHVTRFEYDRHEEIFRRLAAIGVRYVRCDFDWKGRSAAPDAVPDFSRFDRVVSAARNHGLVVLPVLLNPPAWADPVQDHLDHWRKWCGTVAARYAADIPVIEIWNEENSNGFWKNPDAAAYVKVLKAAAEAIRSAAPSVRVALGGTGGVPIEFIEGIYMNGGKPYFDIMNVHPYCPPNPPEGYVDRSWEKLKALMGKYGDGDKAVWFTEVGWPTHIPTFTEPNVLRAGLRMARPEKKTWKALYADTVANREAPSQTVADEICRALPKGSTVRACTPGEIVRRLREETDIDAVFYPVCGGDYPADTVDAVRDFLARGGTLVQTGAPPVWTAYREGADGKMGVDKTVDPSRDRARLRLWMDAWWTNKTIPEITKAFSSEAAMRVGLPYNPEGWKVSRFLSAQMLKPGDRMVPIVSGKAKDGHEIAAAAVYFLDSDLKGRIVASTIGGTTGAVSENRQALMVARTLALSTDLGAESVFFYCMRSPERDPHYSEDHFGLTHEDLSPKPAWYAYRQFVRMRPEGSVQLRGTAGLKNGNGVFVSQWRRPDGRVAGAVWQPGAGGVRALRFGDGEVSFGDAFGARIRPESRAGGSYAVTLGESPVYFAGAPLEAVE